MLAPKDLWYCYAQGKLVDSVEACRSGIRVATRGLPIDPHYDAEYGITQYLQSEETPKPRRRRA